MKIGSNSFLIGGSLVVSLLLASPAHAKTKHPSHSTPSSASSHSSSSGGSDIEISPETLRSHMLNGGTSVLTALNNVYQAKEQVNKSRANLLPSLNLGIAAGPSFALSAMSFLLPFLVPSNWYNLDASKHQLTADGYAYYITELNAYASGLAVYSTILGDIDLRDVYQKQYENYSKIYDVVSGAARIGAETPTDVATAASEMELARVQVSQVDELIVQEKASMREMLGLPIESNLVFTTYHFPALADESTSPRAIFHRIQNSTPERNQITSLIAAAKDETWAASWGFLGGTTLGVSTGSDGGSFGKLSAGVPLNLGFGIFPSVALSNLNVDQLKIREKEIDLETASAIETAWGSLSEAQIQLTQGQLAQADAQRVFDDTLLSYRLGTTDLLHVIEAANTSVTASAGRAHAQIDVDNQRISLNRILISNQFKGIPTCNISMASQGGGGGIFGFFKHLFGGAKATKATVDSMCKPGAASF